MEAQGAAAQDMFKRESKSKNKLVIFGTIATAAILIGGITSFKRGADAATNQWWMRARIASQLATVAVMTATGYEWQRSSTSATSDG